MPKMDGEELLKKLRKKMSIPIIFLTSKDEEVDELLGLKLGADDFVKKSGGFSMKVLIERIRVQLRKKTEISEDNKNIITHGKLKLDPSQLECEWAGKALPDKLTTTEFLIVKELAKRPGVIKERAHLMDIAYKENTEIEDRTIDSHVKRIRKKFKKLMKNFLRLKQDTEVGIDGMLVNETKNSNSILRKFLLFNLLVFSILGLITFIYLSAIQPNLVKKRTTNHYVIIKNTNDHLERLNIKFDRENLKTFLLSTRFLFQSLDRVQFYSIEGKLIGDTNILDLDQSVFEKSEKIFEESIDGTTITQQPREEISFDTKEDIVKEKIQKKNQKLSFSY